MSEHSNSCPDNCERCDAEHDATMRYYQALFAHAPKPYTREEIEDAYSDSPHKRDSLLEVL